MKKSSFLTADTVQQFRTKLRRWYSRYKRVLPWRNTTDPYRIWLSEIMLQQTTVAAVQPYFDRFLDRFPDVQSLANAEESQVLRLWEGLGYYSRARNIHKTAGIVCAELGGQFPESVDKLQKLPGIGRYTAGAIVSFAFNKPAPIVEANTQRLYARLKGYDEELANAKGKKFLWNVAEELLPVRQPGSFNQALMELGSQICIPEKPLCDHCPVAEFCEAFQSGRADQIPKPKRKKEITDVVHICVAIQKGKKFLIHQYPNGKRWAGLWDFLRWELKPGDEKRLMNSLPKLQKNREYSQMEREISLRQGFQVEISQHLGTIQHAVTRYRIQLICLQGKYLSGKIPPDLVNRKWVSRKQLEDFPLSTTARQVALKIQ